MDDLSFPTTLVLALEEAPLRWMVDLALAVALAEIGVRAWRSASPWREVVHLLAGLALMSALRAQLGHAGVPVVAGCLALAGLAHAWDAWWRAHPRSADRPVAAPDQPVSRSSPVSLSASARHERSA